ncbi:MAG TPA: tetratricopeptide repeat protein [Fimbriimonadaceae bacterium]|nr:tetratricopeptide repeat protein [Fimbriimonadaceae bacterium]
MNLVCLRFGALALGAMFVGAAIAQTPQKVDIRDRVKNAKQTYRDGHLTDALTQFEQLSKDAPESIDIQAWLGFLYLQNHRPQDAVQPLEKAAGKRPNDLEINSNLGSAYLDSGQTDKALTQYLLVEKLDPNFPQAAYNVGTLYLAKKEYGDAVKAFKHAHDLAPNDAYALNDLGVCYENLQDLKNAADSYGRAVKIRPDPAFCRNAGFAYFKLHEYPSAIPYLKASYDANKTGSDVPLALAECYTKTHRLDDAASLYDDLKGSQGDKAAYWFNLGYLKQQAHDVPAAEAAYRKCLEIDGNDLDALTNLGMLLFRKGSYAESEVLFDKLSGLNPSSQTAKHNLAVAAMQAGDTEKATQAWKELVRSNPGSVEPRVQLADALWKKGDFAGAKYHYGQALLQDPHNAAALNGMGLVQLRDTKLKEAAASFRSAIAANSKFVPAYNNLALALEKLNKRKDAIRILNRAHSIDPKDDDVNRNLDRMKAAQ